MSFGKNKPSLMLLLTGALLALLPLLAVLQYRWLGEVSRGERERMQANLQASAAQFCQEFDRELTSVYFHFQNEHTPFAQPSPQTFAARYQQWFAGAPHARLVSEIYQTEATENGALRLSRFNPASAQFESLAWPEPLAGLQRKLQTEQRTQESAKLVIQGLLARREELRL